jgi:alkylation response protein AidB-like acyl-CoA dehydrogenase
MAVRTSRLYSMRIRSRTPEYSTVNLTRAGELGFLCTAIPEEYGGMGGDCLYPTIMIEETAYAAENGLGFALHSDIVAPYILNFGTESQKRSWLPKLATGEIGAIAMTEPGTGSDLQAVKTTAVVSGDDYVINGSKIFITNGYLCDLVIVVAKTGTSGNGAQDISLILVEASRAGFSKGRPLKKIGTKRYRSIAGWARRRPRSRRCTRQLPFGRCRAAHAAVLVSCALPYPWRQDGLNGFGDMR